MLNWKFPSKGSGQQAAQNPQSEVLWLTPFAFAPVSRRKTSSGMKMPYLQRKRRIHTQTPYNLWVKSGAREAVEGCRRRPGEYTSLSHKTNW